MTDGHNVIEDYSHTGLALRQHPITFLRKDLSARNIITCAEAMNARDGRWVYTEGLVLVRQKPGSAKGVMFITIEDETGPDSRHWPKPIVGATCSHLIFIDMLKVKARNFH